MKKDTLIFLDNVETEKTTAGFYSREIVKKVAYRLKTLGVPFHLLAMHAHDEPQAKRDVAVKEIGDRWPKSLLLKITADSAIIDGFTVALSSSLTYADSCVDIDKILTVLEGPAIVEAPAPDPMPTQTNKKKRRR